ncbi:MAG: hypothetical protein KBA91_02135 [Candidatus Moranbacteria bacterium]|nr:hypothetical protein [Candidatus Moranbacteria bacterium]
MSLSVYLWGIRLFTLLAFSVWLGIVLTVDPVQSGSVGLVLFFTSLFAGMLGINILFVTWTYRLALGAAGTIHYLGSAFRQAFLLTFFVVGLILLQRIRVLLWWDALLLLAGVLIMEYSWRKIFVQH